jgi:hypothetical protein
MAAAVAVAPSMANATSVESGAIPTEIAEPKSKS